MARSPSEPFRCVPKQTIHAFSFSSAADDVPEPELVPEADEPDRAGKAFSAAYADPAAALYTGEAIASPAMARKMEVDFIFRTVRGFYFPSRCLVFRNTSSFTTSSHLARNCGTGRKRILP